MIREVVSLQCSPLRGRERFRHFASGFHGNDTQGALLVLDLAETASARNKGSFGVRDESDVEAKAGLRLSRLWLSP